MHFLVLSLLLLTLPASPSAQAPSDFQSWLGSYEYEEWVIPGQQTHKVPLQYFLSIEHHNKDTVCEFQINSMKKKERAQCGLQFSNDTLGIYFSGYLENNFGGTLEGKWYLFKLTRDPMGAIITSWNDLAPQNPGSLDGDFFKKLDPSQLDSE